MLLSRFVVFAKPNGGAAGSRPHDLRNLPIRANSLTGLQMIQVCQEQEEPSAPRPDNGDRCLLPPR